MIRVKMIVSGKVQGVGYRAFVALIARRLNIKGTVMNLEDGRVEIECEAKNKEILDAFISLINRKAKEDDLFSPDVERIDVVSEEEIKKCKFKRFEIYYGEVFRRAEKEMIERSEIATLAFGNLGNKIDGLKEKVEAGNKMLGEKVDNLTEKTQNNFDRMDEKYGKISNSLDRLANLLERLIGFFLSEKEKEK